MKLHPSAYTIETRFYPNAVARFDEATRRITEERGRDYGHPLDDFERIGRFWEIVLGVKVTPLQVAQCMRLVKESRLCTTPGHIDSLVDLHGYARCATMCIDEEARRYFDEKSTEENPNNSETDQK